MHNYVAKRIISNHALSQCMQCYMHKYVAKRISSTILHAMLHVPTCREACIKTTFFARCVTLQSKRVASIKSSSACSATFTSMSRSVHKIKLCAQCHMHKYVAKRVSNHVLQRCCMHKTVAKRISNHVLHAVLRAQVCREAYIK